MQIGIVGHGIVGVALEYGFKKLGHSVVVHDVKYNTSIDDVLDTKTCYICVSTPSNDDGSCDLSNVLAVVKELAKKKYRGVIAIKSTVPPGTTYRLNRTFRNNNICFVPEFLRERCAVTDFTENHHLLVVGTFQEGVAEHIFNDHGRYPKKKAKMNATEAEILKYAHNCFNALRVVFANEIFEVSLACASDYNRIKDALIHTTHLPDMYLDVNDAMRGYRSPCFDKDVPAMAHFVKSIGLEHLKIFEFIEKENDKFEKTAIPGTREDYEG